VTSEPPSRAGVVLLAVGLAALGAAAWIWAAGGFRVAVYGLSLSARTPWPSFAVGMCAIGGGWLVRRARLLDDAGVLDEALRRGEALLAGGLAVVTFAVGLACGTTVAGGADSSGYISQAALWREGALQVREPLIRGSGSDSAWVFSPLGFRPGIEPGTIVPSYPPGLPLQFAVASSLGERGISLVVPLLGAVAVWLAFVLGRHTGGVWSGLAAATLLASSPVFIYQLVQPMSDVPVTSWWLAAIAGLAIGGRRGPLFAGIAAGVAMVTRPNLVPVLLAVMPLLWRTAPTANGVGRRAGRRRRLAWFAAGLVPFLLLLAWFNTTLYGAPWASGYGDAGPLFSPAHVGVNVRRYAGWLLDTHAVLLALAAAAIFVVFVRSAPARPRGGILTAAGCAALVFACYLPYSPFESWTYLRFLLPAIAALAVVAGSAWAIAVRAMPPWMRLAACTVGLALVAAHGTGIARARGAFEIADREQRYRLVAEWVRDHTAPDAIVFAAQHSGSIHHTSRRTILRWDAVDPWSFTCTAIDCGSPAPPRPVADTVEAPPRVPSLGAWSTMGRDLHELGRPDLPLWTARPLVIVLDADEEPAFRTRLGEVHAFARLDWPPRAATAPPPAARVYLVDDSLEYRGGKAIATELIARPR
jgi:hypothetical protein